MYIFYFKIADIVFKVMSNSDVENFFFEEEPYNLNINYKLTKLENSSNLLEDAHINILFDTTKEFEFHIDNNCLAISGDYSEMFDKNYNKQFGLFGNKGIINNFILSFFEKNNYIIFHACAIIHPISKEILIGIGSSGSGKSLFVAQALSIGWRLIGTEHIIVSKDYEIYLGNYRDNCSRKSIEYVESTLKNAIPFKDKILQDPTFSKVLVDFSEYQYSHEKINLEKFSFVILNFGNTMLSSGIVCNKNDDFVLREIQFSSSEKILAPIIFGDWIYSKIEFLGNAKFRSSFVKELINKSSSAFGLGGDAICFKNWLQNKYEECKND